MFTFCSSGVRLPEGPAPRPNRRAGATNHAVACPGQRAVLTSAHLRREPRAARHDRYLAIQRSHVVHARFRVTSSLLNCICNSATIPSMVARATHEEEWFKLSPEQRAAWSGFIRAHASIVKELDAELQAAHGLPLSSYDVLVQLSLAPNGRMQMFELAKAVHLSRSGLTRLVDRLEGQGLLERYKGDRDPRQVFACITERGLERLAETTPTHLAGVRRRFLERLSRAQVEQLAIVWNRLLGSDPEREPGSRKP